MIKTISTLLLCLTLTFTAFSQSNDEYRDAVKELFDVSGSKGAYEAALDQLFPMLTSQYPSVDENIWIELRKEFDQTSMDDLVDMLVPVYKNHLTLDDLKGVIAFYNTPAGKKYAEKTPLITQESMQIGQEWGIKIGQKFAEKMAEKGY